MLLITCVIRYVIDPHKLEDFERYARRWMALIDAFGGVHHGYFLPHEGASDDALALFSFGSLAEYEAYRTESRSDRRCIEAYEFAKATGCVLRHERTFMTPCLRSTPGCLQQMFLTAASRGSERL